MVETIVFLIGLIQIFICVICFYFKKKWQMNLCVFSFNFLLIIQFILEKHYTECYLMIIDVSKTVLFLVFDFKKWKPNLAVIIFFQLAMIACSIITWERWYSIFLLLANMVLTYAYWQTSTLVIRFSSIIASIFLILNYIFVGLYSTIIAEIISLTSASISLFVFRKQFFKKREQKNLDESLDLNKESSENLATETTSNIE